MSKRKFKWMAFDYDYDGEAYIIAKDECPDKAEVPKYICEEDCLSEDCLDEVLKDVKSGWCRFSVGYDDDGDRNWGYMATDYESDTMRNGKRMRGWFPVWIVRKGEWY